MSFLGKIFGGKKEEKGPDAGSAIVNLRETENMLLKKQEYLEKKIEAEIKIARENGTKNKRAALQALKRKNRYAKQLEQIDGTLSTLEMQREALEGANTNTAVLESMKHAADAMKKAHNHMDVDQVHNMMDDIGEQQDLAKEISEAISNPVAFGQDIDNDDLEQELEKLEQEALDEELLKAGPSSVNIPAPLHEPSQKVKGKPVPAKATHKEAVHKEKEDPEMKDLEAWAS